MNNSYPNQNLVKVKTINFFTFLFFLKFPNIWINIQKQTDLFSMFFFFLLQVKLWPFFELLWFTNDADRYINTCSLFIKDFK